MQKTATLPIVIALLLYACTLSLQLHAQSFRPQTATLLVPDNFPTIQEAINAAAPGDTILVKAGTYLENVLVDKPISLIGEDLSTTIIDGSKSGTVIEATANNVSIENFTVRDAGYSVEDSGIELSNVENCTINRNILTENGYNGIMVSNSVGNTVSRNTVTESTHGIILVNSGDDTVSENNVKETSRYGIALQGSDYCKVTENNITNCYEGIVLLSSNKNSVSRNTITRCASKGIRLDDPSDSNTFTENTLADNGEYGFWMWYSSHNRFYHNNCNNTNNVLILSAPAQGYNSTNTWDNGYPFGGNYWSDYKGQDHNSGAKQNETGADGIGDTAYIIDAYNTDHYPLMHPWNSLPVQNINTGMAYATIQAAINANETVNENKIFVEAGTYYENVIVTKTISLIGESEETIIIDANKIGSVVKLSADNVTIMGFTFRNSGPSWAQSGVALSNVRNCNVSGNMMISNNYGVWLESSTDNTILGNSFADDGYAIALYSSSNRNTILENNLTSSSHAGILLASSIENEISRNSVTQSEYSVELISSSNNTITKNNVEHNSHGIALYESSSDNNVVGNTLRGNGWGLETDTSTNNRIYHNNFINNVPQVYVYEPGYPNTWDADYPEGGNYWSDQNRIDSYSGRYQNETNSDGIADIPYSIDINNEDNYPLMGMFYDFDICPLYPEGTMANVEVISDSTVTNLSCQVWLNSSTQYLHHDQPFILFSVAEENGTASFCRLTIPATVLNASTYTVLVDWNPVNVVQLQTVNSSISYVYFTFTSPNHEIIVTTPEIPSAVALTIALVATSAFSLFLRKKRAIMQPNFHDLTRHRLRRIPQHSPKSQFKSRFRKNLIDCSGNFQLHIFQDKKRREKLRKSFCLFLSR